MYFEIYKECDVNNKGILGLMHADSKEWRWRLKGDNHEIVASGESYKNRADCLHAINQIMGISSSTKINDLTQDCL